MYPRNAASPPRISIGAVVQISDGAVQTAGVSVAVRTEGGAETAGSGTVSYGTLSGIVYYTPTQAETDHTAFVLVAYKTGCIPIEKSVVTTASATPGYAGLDWSKVGNPTTAVALSSTTISTSQAVASVTARVTANIDQWGGVAVTGMPLPTASYTTPPTVAQVVTGVYAALPADHTVAGSYGVRLILALNSNRELQLTGSHHAAADVHEFQPDVIDSAALAASAITEIQTGLATLVNQTLILDRQGFALAVLAGTISDAQTAAETYAITINGSTYTVDFAGLDASGNRSGQTLVKT
jgi:hypothetical protein